MKKLSLMLAFVLVFACVLVACNDETETSSTPEAESSVAATDSSEADVEESSEAAIEESSEAATEESSEAVEESSEPEEVSEPDEDDGENWGDAIGGDILEDDVTNVNGVYELYAAASGRYVQFRFTSSSWAFISEIEVYGAAE